MHDQTAADYRYAAAFPDLSPTELPQALQVAQAQRKVLLPHFDALDLGPKCNPSYRFSLSASYFERLGTSEEISIGRGDRPEQIVTLTRGYTLLRPYQLPYGGNADAR